MASPNPVRRTALVTSVVFSALLVAVGIGSYTKRDDGISVAVRDSQPVTQETASPSDSLEPNDTVSDTTVANTTVANNTVANNTVANNTVADTTLAETASPSTTNTFSTTTSSTIPDSSTTTTTSALLVASSPCPALDGSSARTTSFKEAPPVCIDERATYSAILETSEGAMTIALTPKNAPNTVNNFVFLSRYHFYDGLTIHRVVPEFILQGGDPLANSNGGPGYQFDDELPGQDGYDVGSVAMANNGVNTNGSQFFIVTGPTGSALKGTYSTFGKVTKGKSVLSAIDKLGRPPANDVEFPPTKTITIVSITIKSIGERQSRIPGFDEAGSVSPTVVSTTTTKK